MFRGKRWQKTMIPYYQTPEEGQCAAIDMTDKALGAVIAQLGLYLLEKQEIRRQLERTDDEEEIGNLEWQLKLLRNEEGSLQRIMSGLQSRLRVGT